MDETALVFTDFLTPSDLTSLSAASAWTGASVVPIVDSGAWKKISLTTLFTAPTIAGNATFTGAIISPTIGPASGQQHTLPAVTSDTVALIAASQTLTNKTISGSANTLSSIANASLTNSSVTVTAGTGLTGGGTVALGGTITLNATGGGVTSLAGTSNQINASASTGAVTLSLSSTLSLPGTLTISANGAVSAPAVSITGTPYSGGTATTTKPMFLIETAGATSTNWNTLGTLIGGNAAGGFTGPLLSLQQAAEERFRVAYDGSVTIDGDVATASYPLTVKYDGTQVFRVNLSGVSEANAFVANSGSDSNDPSNGTFRTNGYWAIRRATTGNTFNVDMYNSGSPVTALSIDQAGAATIRGGATFLATSTALTDYAAAQTGTLTNAPAAGNPSKWIRINDNGTMRAFPVWNI